MKRTLGRSGIDVSALGMGTWAIGGTQDGKDGKRMVAYETCQVEEVDETKFKELVPEAK